MKPSRKEMIQRIIQTEIDGMDMEGLIMFAEDNLWDHFILKDDKYIEQVFDEMFENDLERLTDEH